MRHPFVNYLVVRDEYFEKPHDVIAIANTLQFNRNPIYPGKRTDNILAHPDPEVRKFGHWFSNEISYNIFPGLRQYEMFLCFHENDTFDDPEVDAGWIHNDYGNLAGLVYLTPDEEDLNTGTSIFLSNVEQPDELPTDAKAREMFNVERIITPEFKTGLLRNRSMFENKETIRVGNRFNRLVAYDSKLWHRPNSFGTSVNKPRLTLLFFVSKFEYTPREY